MIRDEFRKDWNSAWGKIDKIDIIFTELAMIFPVISEIQFDEDGNAWLKMCYRYAVTDPKYINTPAEPVQEIKWQSTEVF